MTNAVIVGKRRLGKSTLAFWLACRKRIVIIFDPNAQFKLDGRVAFKAYSFQDLEAWLYEGGSESFPVCIFRPAPERLADDFTALCELLWPLGNYALILDEAACVQGSNTIHPKLARIVRQAPREGPCSVLLVQTSHRMQDFHGICKALSSDFFLFHTTLARDLELIEEQFGADVRDQVQTLGRFELIHCWTDENGRDQWMKWDDPSKWYVRLDDVSTSGNHAGTRTGTGPGINSPGAGAGDPGNGGPVTRNGARDTCPATGAAG